MTLTQLSAFVLVARLGSVKAAADALSVSEPAVSQAIAALRKYLGDPLLTRGGSGMVMTPGGQRLLTIAAQVVALGAEAETAVRSANGAPEPLRLVATSSAVEFVLGPLAEAFGARSSGRIEVSTGVAATSEMSALVSQRLADVALGPDLSGDRGMGLVSEPIFRAQMVVLGAPGTRLRGAPVDWSWLVDSEATDPGTDVARLLRALGIPESRLRVFPNQTAAWDAAAGGAGVTPALAHLAVHRTRRRELAVVDVPGTPKEVVWHATTLTLDRRSAAAGSMRHFLSTPEAMKLLRSPGSGVPPSRFRPPIYVTIWN
ncbi:LysR family transcriptional regulator [Pseudonocardia endophytica]|uniref:LysR family transcriptional regulator n=1 Tax=Pseudonocardia endophytica TaxID=401976 RepID=A0A4R1I138_PSEEN|nr:LysR family transcriptional regulator [Pseudonocardia endophytica]TCK27245.1 LysR family transcriptional regulator [Pseudonocardia endophytica]